METTTTENAAAQVVDDYLTALSAGDFDTVAGLLTEDFSFRGPLAQADGRDQFVAGASRLAPIVRGHELLHRFVDGHEICSIYDFHLETPAGAGSVVMSEWCSVRDGRVASSRLIYDSAAWTALVK